MPVKITVDHDRLEAQMNMLTTDINEVPEFDDSYELSFLGNMECGSKYVTILEKVKVLINSYKDLMNNSVTKASSAVGIYRDADEEMSSDIVNTNNNSGSGY